MSPVHVVVGTDPRAEAMWAEAFAGAVDLYRFDRNVDAFERLTAAQAPIDLVILTPAQDGLFNLTPDQFVARVLEGPLATTPMLANLHIIVVGAELTHTHPRAVSTRTLDAAIRLVKFGEIEAPRVQAPVAAPIRPTSSAPLAIDMPVGGSFSDSVISRIWAAADSSAPIPAADVAPSDAPRATGGGPAAPAGHAQLFSSAGSPRATQSVSDEFRSAVATPVTGGGPTNALAQAISQELQSRSPIAAPMQVDADGEILGLQSARPYVLPNGGAYVGPEMRRNQIPPASSHNSPTAPKPPVPPAIASQIRTMVYAQGAHAPADPLLTWSSNRGAGATAPATSVTVPVPAAQMPAAPAPVAPVAVPLQPIAPPMQPPAGVYGTVAAPGAVAATPQPVDAPVSPIQADPFVQRAIEDGGVSFG